MTYIQKKYDTTEKFYGYKVCFYDGGEKEYKQGAAADKFARKCALAGKWCSLNGLTDKGWMEIAAC